MNISHSNRRRPVVALAAVVAVLATAPVKAADSFENAFLDGDWNLQFRYRFEFVEDDFFPKDAEASTLRTRLNYGTDPWKGWSAFVEFDYVTDIIWDDYNAGGGNTPDKEGIYPTVADPTGSDFNQGYVQYAWAEKGHGRAGRQRIIYDNARFVGNVGWRQNEQTYDAAALRHNTGSFDIQYAYLWNVNRIFGDEVNAGDHEQSTNLLNGSWTFDGIGKLTGMLYDIDNNDLASFSTTTWGVRWVGMNAGPINYTINWSTQSDNANNPVDYDADYWRLDLSYAFDSVTPYIGYESLGGSDTKPGAAFRTPLATLHAFNGWADKFLTTPDEGLVDAFIGVKGKIGAWSWNVLYHDFSAEAGSRDWGTEIDASLSRQFANRYGLLFKLADFSTDAPDRYGDTTKIWVQFTAGFGGS